MKMRLMFLNTKFTYKLLFKFIIKIRGDAYGYNKNMGY